MRFRPDEMLEGQRILEWVGAEAPPLVHIAVGFAGRLLADLGADLLRVTPTSDPLLGMRTTAQEIVGDSGGLACGLRFRFTVRGRLAVVERSPSAEAWDPAAGTV